MLRTMFLVIETPETMADPDTPLGRYMLAFPRQAGQNLRRAIRVGQRCQGRVVCVEEILHPQNKCGRVLDTFVLLHYYRF